MDRRLAIRLPLVAILRGLEPDRATEVGETLLEAGFEIVEVPLNSPDAFASISTLVSLAGNRALVGAGTVLEVEQVDRLADIGAGLVVSPNCDPQVVARTAASGMVSFPGVVTPSDIFTAIAAGATGVKIFPAEMVPPAAIKAMRAVLPTGLPVVVVGGIHAGNMGEYLRAGATGFGMGGAVFKPGKPIHEIARDARAIVEAFRKARA